MTLTNANAVAIEAPREASDNVTPKRESLDSLLTTQDRMTAWLDDPDFDPALFAGDFDGNREAIAAKVDAINDFLWSLETYANGAEARIAKTLKRISAARKRRASLETFVQRSMEARGLEKLGGIQYEVVRKRSSNPSVDVDREPTADDVLTLGDAYVKVEPQSYAWRRAAMCAALKEGDPKLAAFARLSYSYRIEFDEREKPPGSRAESKRAAGRKGKGNA